MFHNQQIELSDLPRMEDVKWQPLQRKYLPVSLLGTWIFGLGICAVFLFVHLINPDLMEDPRIFWGILGGVLLLFLTISVLSFIGFKHKGYALREHDILYKSGWIFRTIVAVPFNRIQHSEIKRGPLERQYNLSEIRIFTAGGQGSDLLIPGLLDDDAQNLKTFLMEKIAARG